MKKYIAILLCTAFILGLTVPTNVLAVDYSDSNGVITQAQYAPAGVDINAPITGEKWGEPTISVDKDSENAFLWQHNALPEESSMDIYFRWDDTYIYIGVVSPDEDPRGSDDSWTGDGLQFKPPERTG